MIRKAEENSALTGAAAGAVAKKASFEDPEVPSPTAPLSPTLSVSGQQNSVPTLVDSNKSSGLAFNEETGEKKCDSDSLCIPYARWVTVNPIFSDSIPNDVFQAKLVSHFSVKSQDISVKVNMESFSESRQ